MEQTTQNTPAPVVDTSTSQAPPATTPAPQSVSPTPMSASDTPAEVVYQSEGSLPPITSLDDLRHIRAIDKQGRSVTMTPAQIRELTGIDYSKLEEQIVPGECWPSADGKSRQVYVRTFIGTLPATPQDGSQGLVVKLTGGIKYEQIKYVCGGIISDDQYNTPLHANQDTYWTLGGSSSGCWILTQIPTPATWMGFDKQYKITIKYTKL